MQKARKTNPNRDDFKTALECMGIEAERLRLLSISVKRKGENVTDYKVESERLLRVIQWLECAVD